MADSNSHTPLQYALRQYATTPTPYGSLILLAVIGLVLALGAYNPLYYLLWRFVPGFDLFRTAARWLALYAVGMAGLAGVGLDVLGQGMGSSGARSAALSRSAVSLSTCFLVYLPSIELWLGARDLPFTLAAAPSTLSLRNAPAALLAATADQPAAGRDSLPEHVGHPLRSGRPG